ncbi:MAG: hypothetical protein ABFC88_13000 [Thermoguttaceae bacterium]
MIEVGQKYGVNIVWKVIRIDGAKVWIEDRKGRQTYRFQSDELFQKPYARKVPRYGRKKRSINYGDHFGDVVISRVVGIISDGTVVLEGPTGRRREAKLSDAAMQIPRGLGPSDKRYELQTGDIVRGWVIVEVLDDGTYKLQSQKNPERQQVVNRSSTLFRPIRL